MEIEHILMLTNVDKFVDEALSIFHDQMLTIANIPPEAGNEQSFVNVYHALCELGDFVKRLHKTKETVIENDFCNMMILAIIPAIALSIKPSEFHDYVTTYMMPIIQKAKIAKMQKVPLRENRTVQ